MRLTNYRALALQLYFLLARAGWMPLIAATLIGASLFFWLSLIPYLQTEIDNQHGELQRSKRSLYKIEEAVPVVQQPLADVRAASFYTMLGDKAQIERQLKVLFDFAKKAGLALHQADYKAIEDKNGNFHTYQIQLPVIGSYSAIRQFCESVLLAVPYASLDEMSFKREAVSSGKLEAKLRFTLYLSDKPKPPSDMPPTPKGVKA
jgi:Tfp pilus assembly protein PilO